MKQIAEDIKNRTFQNAYLIYGEDAYLRKRYRDTLLEALDAESDSMNFTRFVQKQATEDAIIAISETMPFFSERRVVLVEDSGLLKEKTEKLADYAAKLPEYLVLIFVESEADRRNRLYKALAKYDRVVRCTAPDEKGLTNWILVELKKNGKTIRRNTLEMFLSGAGSDLNFISCELEKLISYTGERSEILPEDIRAVCSVQIENRIFDMIADAAAGRREKALKEYYDLLLLKEAPMRILFLMERQFDQLLRIKELLERGEGEKLIAEQLKVHPYVVKKNLPLARKYPALRLRQAVEDMVRAEEDVKTGRLTDKMSVELMLVKYSLPAG